MNNVLELKGKRFFQDSRPVTGGGASMNGKVTVTIDKINSIIEKLKSIKLFWQNEKRPFSGILISVRYNKIVAKSNRISALLKGADSNYAIVGAKFNDKKDKHIITYYIDMVDLDNTISLLSVANQIMNDSSLNSIDQTRFNDSALINRIRFDKYAISKSTFKQVIADISYIDDFVDYDREVLSSNITQSIITLYDTGVDTKRLLSGFGIDVLSSRILDNLTVFLDENQLRTLIEKAPYLVAMATENLSSLSPDDFKIDADTGMMYIPSPGIEPTIGVIDTLFDDTVYFHDWVEYHDMTDENLKKTTDDKRHGTAVTSIIVDGPTLNPWLDDGGGRFRVRHFGVSIKAGFSSFTIIKLIKQIISENRDIKVWNLSLGSDKEISDNYISAEAAVLDKLQNEYDIIFVIAGKIKHKNISIETVKEQEIKNGY